MPHEILYVSPGRSLILALSAPTALRESTKLVSARSQACPPKQVDVAFVPGLVEFGVNGPPLRNGGSFVAELIHHADAGPTGADHPLGPAPSGQLDVGLAAEAVALVEGNLGRPAASSLRGGDHPGWVPTDQLMMAWAPEPRILVSWAVRSDSLGPRR